MKDAALTWYCHRDRILTTEKLEAALARHRAEPEWMISESRAFFHGPKAPRKLTSTTLTPPNNDAAIRRFKNWKAAAA